MKTGVIGTGNMGRILIEALLDGKALSPSSLIIMNRSIKKALEIQELYEGLTVVSSSDEVAKEASLIFICVKPGDVRSVIHDITPFLRKEDCVVSITSPISVRQLESVLPCSVARAIPSITNRALAGVTLVSFGENCDERWKKILFEMLRCISTPVIIEEEITRVASDIVSCGPAFYSYLTRRFIEAAVKETKIDEETATKLATGMLTGLGELLRKGYYTLPALQEKVCVKGGITGEGIYVLENELGSLFEHVFQRTHAKFEEDLKMIREQFPKQ